MHMRSHTFLLPLAKTNFPASFDPDVLYRHCLSLPSLVSVKYDDKRARMTLKFYSIYSLRVFLGDWEGPPVSCVTRWISAGKGAPQRAQQGIEALPQHKLVRSVVATAEAPVTISLYSDRIFERPAPGSVRMKRAHDDGKDAPPEEGDSEKRRCDGVVGEGGGGAVCVSLNKDEDKLCSLVKTHGGMRWLCSHCADTVQPEAEGDNSSESDGESDGGEGLRAEEREAKVQRLTVFYRFETTSFIR